MPRGWVWLHLAAAWLPLWVLFAVLIVVVHDVPPGEAAFASLRMIGAGALLGIAVYRFASRTPWPYPFRLRFIAVHTLAAALYAIVWYALIILIDSLVMRRIVVVVGPGVGAFLVTGIWLYIVVAGVAYANLAAQRSARIEAHAARMQLAALRSQLHPHFLFNALHTVVQLIPIDPRSAARAAEQLAGVLRTSIEEQRDLIPLAQEIAFVERYLAIERIRFGDRLEVRSAIDDGVRSALLPSFALQTLVENAVRHGATPRIETTRVTISARSVAGMLSLEVADDGAGAQHDQIEGGSGTGLRRLRERLHGLYGQRARLEFISIPGGGFRALLSVPLSADARLADADRGDD
jgi:two-component system, LytTR family, sensor kinase